MTTFTNSPASNSDCPDYAASQIPTQTPRSLERLPIAELTPDLFAQHYQKQGVPVILTDLLTSDCDWHLDYLCEQLGNQAFLLRYYGQERYQQDKREWTTIGSGVQTQSQPFREYAELLRRRVAHEQDIYLAKCSLQNTPLAATEVTQTMQEKFANRLGFTRAASSLNLWVGPSGHMECLHYDPMDGTLMQLHGSKRIVLFPPSQTFNLYPFPVYAHLRHGLRLRSWFSRVYPDRPDFAAFPKLRQAMQYRHEITLNPGEMLYIPAGWWHEITSLSNGSDEMVCSINRFWRVYPTARAFWFWGRWRAYLGSICAIPHTLASLALALVSRERQQKIKEILQMI